MTSKHPSLPGTALGVGVEIAFVKGGRIAYVPWIWLTSDGLTGAERVRRVTRVEYGGGMEYVWRLRG